MRELFTEEEYEQTKWNVKLKCECYRCGQEFGIEKHNIKKERANKRGWGKYCSRSCLQKDANEKRGGGRTETQCGECGKSISVKNAELKNSKSGKCFCNASCFGRYNMRHKTWGSRRSKFEIWCEKRLTKNFPNIKIVYNSNKEVGLELDIFIPDMKLAFEINGIFHYEPIYGTDNFDKIISKDKQKMINCYEKGIELVIIDCSQLKYTIEHKYIPYYDIIDNIIRSNMGRIKNPTYIVGFNS